MKKARISLLSMLCCLLFLGLSANLVLAGNAPPGYSTCDACEAEGGTCQFTTVVDRVAIIDESLDVVISDADTMFQKISHATWRDADDGLTGKCNDEYQFNQYRVVGFLEGANTPASVHTIYFRNYREPDSRVGRLSDEGIAWDQIGDNNDCFAKTHQEYSGCVIPGDPGD